MKIGTGKATEGWRLPLALGMMLFVALRVNAGPMLPAVFQPEYAYDDSSLSGCPATAARLAPTKLGSGCHSVRFAAFHVNNRLRRQLPNAFQQFTGKERDAETGLDYFGARYMSAAQGRFTSPDPKLFSDATFDPQSWNKYGYVRNNPLRLVDPNGEDWKEVGQFAWA